MEPPSEGSETAVSRSEGLIIGYSFHSYYYHDDILSEGSHSGGAPLQRALYLTYDIHATGVMVKRVDSTHEL